MADNDPIQTAHDAVSAFNDSAWDKFQELFASAHSPRENSSPEAA